MWVFQHRGHHRYLATNPKVMSRSLHRQPTLVRIRSRRPYLHFAAKSVWRGCPPHYVLLTRDPYTRLESYFREKLRLKVMEALDDDHPYVLKRHQRIFYPWLGVTRSDPVQAQVDALLGLSFERFIELLPEVYRMEDHLTPQTWNYERTVLGRSLRMPFDAIAHIEDAHAMEQVAQLYELDLNVRTNSSQHLGPDTPWTPAGREIVRGLYRSDFSAFGYSDE